MSDAVSAVSAHPFEELPFLCDFIGFVRSTSMSPKGEFSVTFVVHEDLVADAVGAMLPNAIGFPRRIQIRDIFPEESDSDE